MLTLRQIEVIRAIVMAGTVKGAADFLGVSAPGISRVMKHAEAQLGVRLRFAGRSAGGTREPSDFALVAVQPLSPSFAE